VKDIFDIRDGDFGYANGVPATLAKTSQGVGLTVEEISMYKIAGFLVQVSLFS